jgi:hypothetical protein
VLMEESYPRLHHMMKLLKMMCHLLQWGGLWRFTTRLGRLCLSPSAGGNASCLLRWLEPSCGVCLMGVYASTGRRLLEVKGKYFS